MSFSIVYFSIASMAAVRQCWALKLIFSDKGSPSSIASACISGLYLEGISGRYRWCNGRLPYRQT